MVFSKSICYIWETIVCSLDPKYFKNIIDKFVGTIEVKLRLLLLSSVSNEWKVFRWRQLLLSNFLKLLPCGLTIDLTFNIVTYTAVVDEVNKL